MNRHILLALSVGCILLVIVITKTRDYFFPLKYGKGKCAQLLYDTTVEYSPEMNNKGKIIDWRTAEDVDFKSGTWVMFVSDGTEAETSGTGRAYVKVAADTPENPNLSRNAERVRQFWFLTSQINEKSIGDCSRVPVPAKAKIQVTEREIKATATAILDKDGVALIGSTPTPEPTPLRQPGVQFLGEIPPGKSKYYIATLPKDTWFNTGINISPQKYSASLAMVSTHIFGTKFERPGSEEENFPITIKIDDNEASTGKGVYKAKDSVSTHIRQFSGTFILATARDLSNAALDFQTNTGHTFPHISLESPSPIFIKVSGNAPDLASIELKIMSFDLSRFQ